MTNPTPDLRNDAIHFLQKYSDLPYSASVYAVDKLCSNGFYITRTPTPAPNAGAVKVKPLDLSNMLKHAFIAGRISAGASSSFHGHAWTEYDPTESAAYARILAAIEPTPDPRDAMIARLVEALGAYKQRARRIPFDLAVSSDAALAAAKEVMK